jgi:signal transduction histidine kinase
MKNNSLNYLPSQFTLHLAHEVRNPLSNIKLAVEMLRPLTKNEDEKKILDIVIRASSRINDLVMDLVTPFRAEGIKPEKYSIHLLLDEVLLMAEDRTMLKNITVTKDYTAHDCKIVLNEPKMKIALTNIIVNAVEAMTGQDGKLKILTRSTRDKFIIQIEDNGCGISEENLKNIFKPYFTRKPGGLGLGLASTSDILRSNHITVKVESEVGKGTCFILSLDNSC